MSVRGSPAAGNHETFLFSIAESQQFQSYFKRNLLCEIRIKKAVIRLRSWPNIQTTNRKSLKIEVFQIWKRDFMINFLIEKLSAKDVLEYQLRALRNSLVRTILFYSLLYLENCQLLILINASNWQPCSQDHTTFIMILKLHSHYSSK